MPALSSSRSASVKSRVKPRRDDESRRRESKEAKDYFALKLDALKRQQKADEQFREKETKAEQKQQEAEKKSEALEEKLISDRKYFCLLYTSDAADE